jgi:apolipoprotein N-acyltransferase
MPKSAGFFRAPLPAVALSAAAGAAIGSTFGHDKLSWLSFALVGMFYGLLEGLIPWNRTQPSIPASALLGLAFGLGEMLVGLSWIPTGIERTWPQLPIAPEYLLLAYLSGYQALTGALYAAMRRMAIGWSQRASGWLAAPSFAFAWAISEMVRGTALTGLPMLSLGFQMVSTPFAGYAPIGGVLLVGFATALAAAMASDALLARPERGIAARLLGGSVVLGVVLCGFSVGAMPS